MRGGAPRTVWGTTESDPRTTTAAAAARDLLAAGASAHLIWNPLRGEFVQLLPATSPAVGLLSPLQQRDFALDGRVCITVVVVGRSYPPFTTGALLGLDEILAWLDSWGILRRWPAGRPGAPAGARCAERDARIWAQGGHFGQSQLPGATVGGPGNICTRTLLGLPPPSANGHSPPVDPEPPIPRVLQLRPRFRAPAEFCSPEAPVHAGSSAHG